MILDTFSKINDSTILWNFASHFQFQNKFVYHTKQGKKNKEQLFVSFLFHLNTSCNAPKQEQKFQMSLYHKWYKWMTAETISPDLGWLLSRKQKEKQTQNHIQTFQ